MAKRSDITPELCRQLLDYNPETGKMFWKMRSGEANQSWNLRFAGAEAFTSTSIGYRQTTILGVVCRAHRIAYAIYHGYFPDVIDHINGDKQDNRISNLRSVDRQTNMKNVVKLPKANGVEMGVYFCNNRRKWRAFVNVNQKRKCVGSFDDYDEAVSARRAAARRAAASASGYTQRHIMQRG